MAEDGAHRKIGGPGHLIEINESKFGKREFNRDRRVGKWVLGGFCRTTDECFLVECPNNRRDHHTLLRLIKLYIVPGISILTDNWRGYSALPRHEFVHIVVNHSRGFVDPLTGVHTNTCEGMWFHAKIHTIRGHRRTCAHCTLWSPRGGSLWVHVAQASQPLPIGLICKMSL